MASVRSGMDIRNNKGSKHKKKGKPPPPPGSESDQSQDTNSLSAESQDAGRSPSASQKSTRRKKGEWEILEGLKEGQRFEFVPQKFEGFLLKRRKWPLKGWHKRYFVLEKSILTYAKSVADLQRGKIHGRMDIGMSVISTKARRRRIDIDADTLIFHLKCKSREIYMQWVEQLKQHRLHKQHQIIYSKDNAKITSPTSPSDDSPTDPHQNSGVNSLPVSRPGSLPGTLGREGKSTGGSSLASAVAGGGTLRSWLVDASSLDHLSKELASAQQHVQQLTKLLDAIEHQDDLSQVEGNLNDLRPLSSSNPTLVLNNNNSQQSTGAVSNAVSRPHSYTDAPSGGVAMIPNTPSPTSHPSGGPPPPTAMAPTISLTMETTSREDFTILAKEVVNEMNTMLQSIQTEREKLKQALDSESTLMANHNTTTIISALRNSLNQALQQNAELRGRLGRIHADSDLSEISMPPSISEMTNNNIWYYADMSRSINTHIPVISMEVKTFYMLFGGYGSRN